MTGMPRWDLSREWSEHPENDLPRVVHLQMANEVIKSTHTGLHELRQVCVMLRLLANSADILRRIYPAL